MTSEVLTAIEGKVGRIRLNRPKALHALTAMDSRIESVGESRSLALFLHEHLPLPEPQVDIHDARGFAGRVDFLWREQRTIGEFDGRIKYTKNSFGKDADFYAFWRAMQSYRATFAGAPGQSGTTSIILSPENGYLREFGGRER